MGLIAEFPPIKIYYWRVIMQGKERNTFNATLNRAQVREIREKYATGTWTQGSLARAYGMSVVQIGRIVRNESWNDMPPVTAPPPDPDAMLARLMQVQEEVNRQAEKEKELDEMDLRVKELWGR